MNMADDVVGFVKADGERLINGEGREILLRGVGFGGWLLPEGYMWRFPKQGDRPRRIERMVAGLVGPVQAARFWDSYYERYIAEADIRQIAAGGFNSVRVPIPYRFLIEGDGSGEATFGKNGAIRYQERHLELLDRLIGWCRASRLYVILDLHAAPGGQTGTNIDDSERDQPELFTDKRNQSLTVAIWRMLAGRYRDEWIVAGYDLLNEPLPEWFSTYNPKVMPLYREIIKAIREVDSNHLIILEGVHWATDWSIFSEASARKIDGNLMLQFHKYWNNPDTESIRVYLDKRREWEIPIFMGEGGENNKDWYAGTFQMLEEHNVSWNFWTWKKMDTDNSPCSVAQPPDWQKLTDYLEGGPKPDQETAARVLGEYLDNLPFERCHYHPEVADSLFRRPPLRIPAVFYGYRGPGVSFGIKNRSELHHEFRMHDGTDIRFVQGTRSTPNFQHGRGEPWQEDEWLCIQLTAGDWLEYQFNVGQPLRSSSLSCDLRLYAPEHEGRITVEIDGAVTGSGRVKEKSWQTVRLPDEFRLEPGTHRMILRAEDYPVHIQWLEILPSGF